MLLETGLITKASAATLFVGPEGAMVASLAGCVYGMGAGGVKNVYDLWQKFR